VAGDGIDKEKESITVDQIVGKDDLEISENVEGVR
jgi:hypothetical protein